MEYNIYCDESCHLQNDNSNVMVLGAVWCILLPENVSTSIVEKRLKLATRKNERNEKKIQFSLQSTGCH